VAAKKTLKICPKGHRYYKSSDCPTCPYCEAEKKPKKGFLSLLAAPARRALENNKIKTLLQLSKHTEKEILALHGMGKSAIPKLKKALEEKGLSFKKYKA
jgi:DNA-directed RNA polymerase alpha subunit